MGVAFKKSAHPSKKKNGKPRTSFSSLHQQICNQLLSSCRRWDEENAVWGYVCECAHKWKCMFALTSCPTTFFSTTITHSAIHHAHRTHTQLTQKERRKSSRQHYKSPFMLMTHLPLRNNHLSSSSAVSISISGSTDFFSLLLLLAAGMFRFVARFDCLAFMSEARKRVPGSPKNRKVEFIWIFWYFHAVTYQHLKKKSGKIQRKNVT